MDEVLKLLTKFKEETGVPFAYDHYSEEEAVDPPFICYRCPNTDHFSADGTVYFPIDMIDIELYTDRKDPALEKKLQKLLKKAGIFYEKTEVWIESERLYEVVYEFETADGSEEEE